MKKLSFLFALLLTSFYVSAQVGNAPQTFQPRCPEPPAPEIVDIVFTYDSDCQTLDWSIQVCNTDDLCPSMPYTLDILIEYCPFETENISWALGYIPPGACVVSTGTIEACTMACITATIVETGQVLVECEEC